MKTVTTLTNAILCSIPFLVSLPAAAQARPTTYLNVHSRLCLDVAENRDAGRVVIARCGDSSQRPFQVWEYLRSGRIVNNRSGMCLDVAENRRGGQVVIAPCGNAAARPFQVWRRAQGRFHNARSGLCLDVAENRDGGRVVIDICGSYQQHPYLYWSSGR